MSQAASEQAWPEARFAAPRAGGLTAFDLHRNYTIPGGDLGEPDHCHTQNYRFFLANIV